MDINYRKKLTDLIRTDLITMSGGKNNMKMIAIMSVLFFGAMELLFSPIFAVYIPCIMGGFFVPMLFHNEIKYHSDKMFCLMPIARRDLVRSRFILSAGLYVISGIVFYLIMLISMKLKIYRSFFDEEIDIIARVIKNTGGIGFINMLYSAAFSYGLICMAGTLRKYFRNSEVFSLALRKANKQDIKAALFVFGIIIFWFLIMSGYLPLGPAVAVFIQLFRQLAESADGILFSAVVIMIAVMTAVYKYICTILEYDEKDL